MTDAFDHTRNTGNAERQPGAGAAAVSNPSELQVKKSPPVVRVSQLSKSFGRIEVIHNVSFELHHGEILAVLGPSGCGKTTLLRLIAGFERPDGGEIFVRGQRVATVSASTPPERRSVGMVFQDYALFPHMTVSENISYGIRDLERWRRKRVLAGMLERIGMEDCGQRYPHQLSGGQQQRVGLARALAPCPSALLLDEPFSNLDADMRAQMRLEVLAILREAKTTVVLVTHDQEEAFTLADRVGVLNRGQLEQLDTPEAVYHRPRTDFVAQFVGQADFLSGQVQRGYVVTELGSFPTSQFLPEDRVRVMIRPDDIDFSPDDQGEAVIVDREFRGSENIFRIRLRSGMVVRSSQPSTSICPLGQHVRLRVNLEHVVAFAVHEEEREEGHA